MANADGQIILGLNISATTANIQSGLNSILNSTKTKQIVLKTAIEKAQTEKSIESLVSNLSKKTVKLGVEINAKDIQGILAQQQKIASTQANLNRQMQEYRKIAKDTGVTLNKDTWNSFNHAIKTEDFVKAREIIKSAKKQIDEYNNSIKKMNADTSVSGSVSSIVAKFRLLNTVSEETKQKITQLKASLTRFENADSEQKKLRAYEALKQRLADLANEYQKLSSIEKTAIGNIPKTLENIIGRSSDLKIAVDTSGINGSGITGLSTKLEDLNVRATSLQERLANLDPSNAADVKKLQEEFAQLDSEFKKVEKDAKIFEDVNSIATFTASIEKAKQKVEEYAQKYSAIKSRPDLVQELERLKNAANNISTPSQLKQWNAEFAIFDTKVRQAGVHCKSFGDILKTAFSNFAQFFSASRIIYEVIASIKKMVTAVKELDSAMIELKKVTDAPESDFTAFFERSKKSAIDYATTMKDIINSTADFSKLGFTFKESEQLAKIASVYDTVGDIDNIEKSTSSIISTMKAFGIETENSISIVDKFNEVGNRFAISSEGIGDALTRSASSMAAANNTIDQTIALITAANTVVQDPDVVGTAFKTISMRIRGAETELKEAGLDAENMAESTAKLREEIMALSGVDIMLDENTFKSTYQILDELAAKWADLTDIQQASITELIAGKRQGNVISALMKNFDIARNALDTSLNSSGSAMGEFEKYLDGITAKSKQFQAAFEALSTSIINSNLLKGLIDTGTTLLTVIDSLIEKLGGFGNTLTIIGLAIAALNFKGTVSLFTSIFNSLKTGFGIVPKVVKTFGDLKAAWEIGQSAGGGFITTLKGASTALIGTASAASIATAAIMAVVAVIAIAVMAHQNYKRSIEEARQKTLEESNAVIDNTNKLKSAYVTYMQYANKASLTSGEEEEFKSAIDQVTESLGYKAKAMKDATAGTEEYTQAMQGAIKVDLQEAQIKAKQATKAAKDNLIDKSYSNWDGTKIDFEINRQFHDMDDDLRNYLDELNWVTKTAEHAGHGMAVSVFKFSPTDSKNAESVVDYYYQLIDLKNKLTEDGKMETQLYEDTNRVTSSLTDTVEDYLKKKYEELSLTYQLNNGIPTTIEEFKKYRDYLNSEMGSAFTFDDNNDKLSNIIDGYLIDVEQYSGFIQELDKVEAETSALDDKIKAYNDLTKQILECNDAQEKANLIAEQNALGKEIEDITKLTSQYDDLTAAYNNWQKALSTKNEGAEYDDIAKGLEDIKKLYDQGLIGTDDFKTAVQLMSNQDLTNATPEQLKDAFEESYPSMQKYFKDGSEGCEAFLKKLSEIDESWAHVNENGDWEINFNDEEVAKELDISVGAVQAIMRKLKEFGFDVDFSTSIESLADLKSVTESANDKLKELKENSKIDVDFEIPDFNANSTNIDDLISQIDSATQILDTFKKEDGTVDLSVEGAQEIKTILAALIMQKQQVSEPAIIELNFDAETAKTEIESAALLVNDFRTKYHELEVKIATGEDTSALQTEIQNIVTQIDKVPDEIKTKLGLDSDEFTTAVDTLTKNTVNVKAGITLDDTALATFNATLLSISPKMLVEAGLDDTLIKNYNPDDQYEKIGTVKYKVDDTLVKKYDPKDIHRTVYYKVVVEGDAGVRGTAFAQGDWGISKSGIALGGELGRELVVRNGKFFTIGDEGAEFFQYQKGDIIFNAEQTKQIFEKGKISSGNRRGRALVEGTAFAGGQTTASGRFYTGLNIANTTNTTLSKVNYKTGSKTKKSKDEETEFERQYKYHQHLLAMDRESTQAYLDWLVVAYKEAYHSNQIELEDFYKYEEEVYDKSKTIFDDIIKDREHAIDIWKHQGNNEQNILNEYKSMQQAVHDQAEYFRSLGLSEENGKIQELQNLWWDYQEKINDIIAEGYENNRKQIENAIDLIKLQMENAVTSRSYKAVSEYTNNIIGYYKQMQESIHEQAEYYRGLGYEDTSDEVSKLSKLWWDYQENIKEAISDGYDALVEKAIDSINKIQDVYDTLSSAAEKYGETGKLPIDVLTSMSEIGIEYISYLKDENSMLSINKERIDDVIAARTNQLAVDTALSYVEKLRLALTDGNITEVNRLIDATESASNATWDLVYSNLALLNLDDTQYKQALNNINRFRNLADNAVKSIYADNAEERSKILSDTKDALDTILDLTMDLVEYEINQEIDALEKQKKKYRDIIQLKKEALEVTKDENDYNKQVAKKVAEIAKLQSQINKLSLDDSREAQAEKTKLEEELSELQTDLADYQTDYSIKKQSDMLDKMADAYDEEKDEEIETLKESISSTEKIYQLAIERIKTGWNGLYDDILNWNYEAGSSIESEIVSAWKLASKAVKEYGSFVRAVKKTTSDDKEDALDLGESKNYGDPKTIINKMRENSLRWFISDEYTQTKLSNQNQKYKAQLENEFGYSISEGDNGYINNATGENLYLKPIDKWEAVDYITNVMYENSKKWSDASDSEKSLLKKANEKMAGYIETLSGQKVWKDENGVWWIDNDKLFDSYGTFHTGGVVGDSNLKQDEVMAILKEGELVIDKQREQGLYKIVDFAQILSERLGKAIDTTGFNNMLNGFSILPSSKELLPIANSSASSMEFSPKIEVNISHSGSMTDSDAQRYGNIAAETALNQLKDAFSKKGITNIGSAALK